MKTTHAATLIAIIAGSTAAIAQPDRGPDGGSSYTCTLSGWAWQGMFGDDFLLSDNWLDCVLINGPTMDLPIYFGPMEYFINGASQGLFYPQSNARLATDYSSPSVVIANGGDFTFTIENAMYTCPTGIVGQPPQNAAPNTGTATLVLDNSVWVGTLEIGRGGGNGCLVLRGMSDVTGGLFMSGGTAKVKNEGEFTLTSAFDGLTTSGTWTNKPGSTLTLASNSPFFRPTGDDTITNQAGATIVSPAGFNNIIEWPITNDGLIEVQQDWLTIGNGATYDGTGSFFVNTDATLALNASLLGENVDVIVEGGGTVSITGVSGPGTMTLDGDVSVTGTNFNTDIINTSNATLNANFDGLTGSGTWINAPGSTLTLASNAPFFRPTDDDDAIVNQDGATIIKPVGFNNSIAWPITNDGLIEVEQGQLSITNSATYDGTGSFFVNADATLFLNASLLGDNVDVVVDGGGTVNVTGVSGPGTMTLEGDVTVSGSHFNTDIINTSNATLNANFDGLTGSGTWINAEGATLNLASNSPFFRPTGDDDAVVNQAGATIIKPIGFNNTIAWPITNDGLIEVEQGQLSITNGATYEGSGSFFVNADATLFLNASLLGDNVDVVVDGGGTVNVTGVSGPGTMTLEGDVTVSGSNFNTDIINTSNATLNANFDGLTGSGTWINAEGATLTLASSTPFFRPTDENDFVLNQAGATIIKPTGTFPSIQWPLTNNGLIEIQQGQLTLTSSFQNAGTILIDEDATLSISNGDPGLKDVNSVITGSGQLSLSSAPALFNRGTLNPTPRDATTNPAGLTIDVRFIQNDDTAVFRTQIGSLAGKLTCTGVFDVGGTVDIQRFGDFEPDGSESFIVIEAEFVSGVFGDYFDNAVPFMGSDTAFGVRTGDLEYDLTYTPTQVIVSNIAVIVPPCNPADIAEPSGTLDLADISAFVTAFAAGDTAADLAEPLGLFDLADISAFVSAFTAGCP